MAETSPDCGCMPALVPSIPSASHFLPLRASVPAICCPSGRFVHGLLHVESVARWRAASATFQGPEAHLL